MFTFECCCDPRVLYRFRGNVLLEKREGGTWCPSFFFSRESSRYTAGSERRGACFKIKLAGSVLSKNTPPLLVAFYFMD